MFNANHLAALRKIQVRLANTGINWVLTGSLAFALQGLPVTVDDIDVQTDEAGAYEIERLFSNFVNRKVHFSSTDKIRSHFGALNVDGIEVEIMGDVQKRLADGSWEAPVDLDDYKRFIPFEDGQLPVFSLAYEREAYSNMGRLETSALLQQWIDDHHEYA